MRAVYESAVERQFSTAQVNTIISVIEKTPGVESYRTRFVSLREEFEKALANTESRREISVTHSELMDAGKGSPDARGRRKFVGDKWGGKYLRAPDIYWTIFDKGRGNLVRLGNIAKVRRGVTTGANDFFLLNDEMIERWGIELEFRRPILTSPQESRRIAINPSYLPYQLFICHADKGYMVGTGALEYIEWGEAQGYHLGEDCGSTPSVVRSGGCSTSTSIDEQNDRCNFPYFPRRKWPLCQQCSLRDSYQASIFCTDMCCYKFYILPAVHKYRRTNKFRRGHARTCSIRTIQHFHRETRYLTSD